MNKSAPEVWYIVSNMAILILVYTKILTDDEKGGRFLPLNCPVKKPVVQLCDYCCRASIGKNLGRSHSKNSSV